VEVEQRHVLDIISREDRDVQRTAVELLGRLAQRGDHRVVTALQRYLDTTRTRDMHLLDSVQEIVRQFSITTIS